MERRFETIAVTTAEVAAALRAVGIEHPVATVEPLGGGKINTNLRVTLADGGAVVVRLYARGEIVGRKEAALYRHLAGCVPVPALLADSDAVELAGCPFAVLSLLPGIPLAEALTAILPDNGYSLGEKVGEAVGSVHAVAFDRAGDLRGNAAGGLEVVDWGEAEDWDTGGEDIDLFLFRLWVEKGHAGQRLGEPLRHRLTDLYFANHGIVEGTERLVHGDLNPTNLLVDPDAGTVGIVDWEFAHVGTPLMDLGNLLRDEAIYPLAFVRGFLDGYQRIAGPLPVNWRRQSRYIDLLSHLEFLSSPEDRPETHRRAISRIEETLRVWDSLPA
jgi:aminoglycoside phosphotransferase (APT) family kinase protein